MAEKQFFIFGLKAGHFSTVFLLDSKAFLDSRTCAGFAFSDSLSHYLFFLSPGLFFLILLSLSLSLYLFFLSPGLFLLSLSLFWHLKLNFFSFHSQFSICIYLTVSKLLFFSIILFLSFSLFLSFFLSISLSFFLSLSLYLSLSFFLSLSLYLLLSQIHLKWKGTHTACQTF